jgi:hypothetical protein
MPTYNIATFSSDLGSSLTILGITYNLTPPVQSSAPYTYHSTDNQTSIPGTSGNDSFVGYGILLTFICGDNVTTIGDRAFVGCAQLTSVTLSNSLTTFNSVVFASSSLPSINIPDSVTNLGSATFVNNDGALKDIYFLGNKLPNVVGGITINSNIFNTTPAVAHVNYSLVQSYKNLGIFLNVVSLPYPCFKEGSKILTMDGYVPVEKLRKGDLVQTLKNSYLPIVLIGKSILYNSGNKERIKDRLYTLPSHNYPDLTDDLVLTGCHSILMDKLTLEQEKAILEKYGEYKITDGKVRLETYLDSRATPYKKEGNFTIYHLALENNDYYGNYGIWANGLLVESCSKRYLNEISNMELIH